MSILILGIFFLAIGLWQARKTGTLSPVISALSFLIGLALVLFWNWMFGLLVVFVLSLLCWLFRFKQFQNLVERRRIIQCFDYFQKKRQEDPELTEDEICRMMAKNIIYHTSLMKDVEHIDLYVGRLFKSEIDLPKLCSWAIFQEFRNWYPFDNNLLQRNADLDKRIQDILLRKGYSK